MAHGRGGLAGKTFVQMVNDACQILDEQPGGVPGDHLQAQIAYAADLFVAGIEMPLLLAPHDATIDFVAIVVLRAITGGPSDVDFRIDGGAPISTLSTGAGTAGLVVSEIFDPPIDIDQLQLLDAISDGVATGVSSVALFASIRSRGNRL